jgi:hypothetical protein
MQNETNENQGYVVPNPIIVPPQPSKEEQADDGLSDLFEVPHPHDHDMETDDLFEVPDEHDNDMETDDLLEIPDEEDVFGGDLNDVFEVRNSDIVGGRKKLKMVKRPFIYRPPSPPGLGGLRY